MAVNISDPAQLHGSAVMDRSGKKLGKVYSIYYDNETDRPEWAAVKSGFFGSHVSLVPLATADFDGRELRVPYDKDQLQAAPHHDPDSELSPSDEAELFHHYGVPYGGPTATAQIGDGERDIGDGGGRYAHAGGADDAMTRSEEQLRVGTEAHEAGRARLRKYVVTENVTRTVPVSHEEVRIEREPITESNRSAAMDGPPISEAEHEVTLHAERPVVSKEAVPKERVRLDTDTVTEQEQVSDKVRKEQIDAEGIGEGRRRR
ncbi:MAG: PRC and DUF2382 domain-containing protein [Pseudonocardiaceae bacterium]